MILYRSDLNGDNSEPISSQPLASSTQSYKLAISPEQTAVFETGGKLYLFEKDSKVFNLLAKNVKGVEFSSDNEKLLWWTDNEIWVMWLKDVFSQPYRKAGDKEIIMSSPNKIIQAIWFTKTNEHIIYSLAGQNDQAQIKITELDSRDQRNTFDIYSAKNPEIYWNGNDNLLYILTGGKLYSLDLLSL